MKTKFIHVTGAALLSLLFIFGLTQSSSSAPPANTGGGTIYYVGPWANATTAGTAVMTTMNSDGSGKVRLGLGMFGNPSTALHNNHRWFIYTYVIPDQYYPDGVTKRSEVFVLRDDFDPNLNNNANTVVRLTDDITLQPRVSGTDWIPGDAKVSFSARRWSSAEAGATIVEAGIYTASLVFGPDGNIVGLAEQPAAPTISFPLVEVTPGELWPSLSHYCWDPTGTQVAYTGYGNLDLWTASLADVHTRIFAGPAYIPQWSPGGDKIAFSYGGIATIRPNGSGFKIIIRNTSTWTYNRAYWSPTGSQIVFNGQLNGYTDVFRATASGGSQVNLTNTPAPFSEDLHPFSGAGWR